MESRKVQFEIALLPSGWARAVTIEIDAGGTIVAVTPDADAGLDGVAASAGGRLDRVAGVAIPGVPNVHSHAHQRAMAGLAEHAGPGADSFWTWREAMYRFALRMTPETLEAVAAQLYVEMLKAGYTAVGEFQYVHHTPDGSPYAEPAEMTLRCAAAATRAGIGFTALPVLYAHGDFGGQPASQGQRRFLNGADGFLDLLATVQDRVGATASTAVGWAPHSLRAVDGALLRAVLDGARAIDPAMPIHIHVAEQRKEVEDCRLWSGTGPVAWLLDHVDVTARWCAIHATHMTDDESARLAASGAVVGLCPTTEGNLGDGIFDGRRFLRNGGAIAIGSDSHITVDAGDELRILEYGQRLRDRARNVLADGPGHSTARSLFDRILRGGAQALARPISGLAVGNRADLVVLDPEHVSLVGASEDAVLDRWVFAGGRAAIRQVWVGGEPVVTDGHHRDEEAIEARFRQAIHSLAQE